jgi:hypothetical protein
MSGLTKIARGGSGAGNAAFPKIDLRKSELSAIFFFARSRPWRDGTGRPKAAGTKIFVGIRRNPLKNPDSDE